MSSLPMPLEDYRRYGRQMILDQFGLDAQLKLRDAKICVVGAGGLGCPALQYLSAAGVGTIGIVDHDTVDLSNLQRQILHTEERIGWNKADSAALAIKGLNSSILVEVHSVSLEPSNARSILSSYNLIIDCTDNAPTRYLLSDTAVFLNLPLVSGAAMKYEGQLCTYNLPLRDDSGRGPCYRCIFPKPPSPELVRSCEEQGVLGVVTGIIGSLQALDAIKIIVGQHEGPSLLLFSALGLPPFRTIKIRPRRVDCPACGVEGDKKGKIEETDYVAFCGGKAPDWEARGLIAGEKDARASPQRVKEMFCLPADEGWNILDVRPRAEFSICRLPNSTNVPLSELLHTPSVHLPKSGPILVVCRLGNDSQTAVRALKEVNGDMNRQIVDMIGGLRGWSRDVDPEFPIY